MNRDMVRTLTGKLIREIRIESLLISKKTVCEVLALYLKIDHGEWYKFIVSDGAGKIELLPHEPELISPDSINDDFAYPVKAAHNNYTGHRITGIKEYLWQGKENECNGFYISLDPGEGFSLFDNDDCLVIVDGIRMERNYILSD